MSSYRLAADIGGTFTDLALLSDAGALRTLKTPSTPPDYSGAIVEGSQKLLSQAGVSPTDISEVLHASTVATNAILEEKGARTALLTTAGFRDVLELRRIRVPRLYEPLYRKPAPLVERRFRFEVPERVSAGGSVVTPLDEDAVAAVARKIAAANIEAVAVCFLHSYVNPAHERCAGEILRRLLPGCFVTLSVDVLPEIREYERTSTTVINAYVGPLIERYLSVLQHRLAEIGVVAPLRIMQSSGGVLDVASLLARPAHMVESGPAAGVIGAARHGSRSGYANLISFDMGGTTAKAAVIENGRHIVSDEYEVGGGISLSSTLVKGGGHALKLPVIDVSEVGAGGGSIVWTDPAGALKVGPHSAGADPGPACYGRGLQPTVTDAYVVLGYLSPVSIAGGAMEISPDAAYHALASIAGDNDVIDLAYAVSELAVANMIRAVKAVTTYRGRDPRDFAMMAFGGCGAISAVSLAQGLGITRIIIPPAFGVFSALGLLLADVGTTMSHSFLQWLGDVDPGIMESSFRELETETARQIGCEISTLSIERRLDMRYAGQAFELTIGAGAGRVSADTLTEISTSFDDEHAATYGYTLSDSHKQVVALRVNAARSATNRVTMRVRPSSRAATSRQVYFAGTGFVETAVIGRAALNCNGCWGPLVIEDPEGTIVVSPNARAQLCETGDVLVELSEVSRG